MAHGPTNSTQTSDVISMRTSDRFAKEFVIDRPIVEMFSFPNIIDAGHDITGYIPGTGHPVLTQVAASGIGGVLLNADSEGYSWLWKPPMDIDIAQAIRFRVFFADLATVDATHLHQFTFQHTELVPGITVLAAPATALTKTTATGVLGTSIGQYSNWATMAASVLTGTPGDMIVNMNLLYDQTNATCTLIRGEAQYYRKYVA